MNSPHPDEAILYIQSLDAKLAEKYSSKHEKIDAFRGIKSNLELISDSNSDLKEQSIPYLDQINKYLSKHDK